MAECTGIMYLKMQDKFLVCDSCIYRGRILCVDCDIKDECDMKAARDGLLDAFHAGFIAGGDEWPKMQA